MSMLPHSCGFCGCKGCGGLSVIERGHIREIGLTPPHGGGRCISDQSRILDFAKETNRQFLANSPISSC